MKMYVRLGLAGILFIDPSSDLIVVLPHRLMSDYEVSLVNDSMQEFYVRFHGPAESASFLRFF